MKLIAGTLKYGWFDGEKTKCMMAAYIVFSIVIIGFVMGLGLTLLIQEFIKNGGINGFYAILAIFGCLLMSFALPCVFGVLIYKNEKQRKEIKLWLYDSVQLTAYAREVGVIKSMIPTNNIYKIRVEFNYEGCNYRLESRGKPMGGFDSAEGFHNVWKDYINKKVNILYSPQFREVIILKN